MKKEQTNQRALRGFALVDPKKLKRICSRGGKSTAAKLGPEHMSTIGRNGRRKRALKEKKAKRLASLKTRALKAYDKASAKGRFYGVAV